LDAEEFDQPDEDAAFDDEADYDDGKNTINQGGVRGGKVDVLPEDSIAPADRDAGELPEDYRSTPGFPISLVITITKPGDQALQISAVAADGAIEVETVNYVPKASALQAEIGKEAQEAHARYEGPPVGNLDAELQLLLERYLEDRGINAELANFLPDYVEYKEQKEYVSWLQSKWNSCLDACGVRANNLSRFEEVHRHLKHLYYLGCPGCCG
jgi:complement component 1 Q subcomponent-binding protein